MKQRRPSRSNAERPQRSGQKFFSKRDEAAPDEQRRPSRSRAERPQRSGQKFFGKRDEAAPDEQRRPSRSRAERPQRSGQKFFGKRDEAAPDEQRRPSRSRAERPQRSGQKFFSKRDEAAPDEQRRPQHKRSRPFNQPAPYADERQRRPNTPTSRPPHNPRFSKPKSKATPSPKQEAPRSEALAKNPRQGVLLWGLHAVREAWLNPKRVCYNLWITEAGRAALAEILTNPPEELSPRPAPKSVERAELDRLLPPNSVHQGIALEAAPLTELALQDVLQDDAMPDLLIVLDQVTDPHNVGAILRSAAALGAGAVIMTERNAPGATGVMVKAASGAAEHVPVIHVVNLARSLAELQQAGYWCVGLAEEGERDLSALDLTARTALVLGAEGDGLRRLTREHCDELARLPTGGPIGSLNVSNAAAVALYEARRQKLNFEGSKKA